MSLKANFLLLPSTIQTFKRSILISGFSSIQSHQKNNNFASYSVSSLFLLIPSTLFMSFRNSFSIWYLFISILEIFLKHSTEISTVYPFFFIIFLNFFSNFWGILKEFKKSYSENWKNCLVWSDRRFDKKFVKDINVGDIILLQENEVLPADAILIATGNMNKSCYVDDFEVSGQMDLVKKECVKEIQSLIDSFDVNEASIYLNTIECVVKVNDPDQSFNEFKGKLKLKNSPKSVNLSIHNLLLSGSRLKSETWIFAVVVYVGRESKISLLKKFKKSKFSVLEKSLEVYNIAIIIGIILISALHLILMDQISGLEVTVSYFFEFILLYHSAIPFSMLYLLYIGRALYCKFYFSGENSCIQSPEVLENLGQIEYIFLEKSGVLTKNALKIRACIIENNIYHLDNKDPNHYHEETIIFTTENPCQTDILHSKITENDQEIVSYFLGLSICNTAFPQESEDFLVSTPEDNCLAKLSAEIGVKLTYRDSKKMTVQINNEAKDFRIIFFKNASPQSKRTRILVYSLEVSQYILYVKGPLDAMIDITNSNATRYIEELNMSAPGIQIIVLGIKVLNSKEADEFMYSFNNAKKSPINKEGRIESVIEQYEEGLSWLGAVCVLDKVDEDVKNSIKSLNSAGIKFIISSGDIEENTVSAGLGSEIITSSSEVVRITNIEATEEISTVLQDIIKNKIFYDSFFRPGSELNVELDVNTQRDEGYKERSFEEKSRDSKKSLEVLRRTSLHPLLSQITQQKSGTVNLNKGFNSEIVDYTLVMDGKSLVTASNSAETLKYLVIILFAAKSVCCFEMFPNHKQLLMEIYKKSFSFCPNILTIGNKSDLPILNTSNVSASTSITYADIWLKSISDLPKIIFNGGINCYHNFCKISIFCLYINVSYVIVLMLYNYLCDFSGTWILNSSEILVFSLVMQVMIIVPVYVFDTVMLESEEQSADVYKFGVFNKAMNWYKIFEVLAVAAVTSGLFLMFLYFTFQNFIGQIGLAEDFSLINLYVFIGYSLILIGTAAVETNKIQIYSILSYTFVLIICVVFIVIENYKQESYLFGASERFFSEPILVISVIMAALVIVSVFYTEKLLRILLLPNDFEKVRLFSGNNSVLNGISRAEFFETNIGSVFKVSDITNEINNKESLTISLLLLKFSSKIVEKAFILENSNLYSSTFAIYVQVYSIIHTVIFFYSAFVIVEYKSDEILLIISACMLIISSILQFTSIYTNYSLTFLKFFFFGTQLMTFLGISVLFQSFPTLFSIYPLFLLLLISDTWSIYLCLTICELILDIYFKSLILSPSPSYLVAQYGITIFSICCISTLIAHVLEYSRRKEYLLISELSLQMNRATNVLSLLLPNFVITRVKNGIRYISEDQGIVTVLFCNICDFEEIFSDFSPYDLGNFLDELFGKFDQLCEIVGVTKIETVGKTYLASAGLRDSDAELDPNISRVSHARRIIELGFGMLNIIQRISVKGVKLHLKIGVNSGRVQAGVVGFHKPQFSLVGDTVNIASRMATTLVEKDLIQITPATYEEVKDQQGITFKEHSSFVKGKGDMQTYLVKVKNRAEAGSLDVTPSPDTRSSLPFGTFSGLISSHGSLPGTSSPDFVATRGSRRNTYAEIECRETLLFHNKSADFLEKNLFFSLSCAESSREKKFRKKTMENSYKIFYLGLFIAILFYVAQLIVIVVQSVYDYDEINSISLWHTIVQTIVYAAIFKLLPSRFDSLLFAWVLEISYIIPIILIILSNEYDPVQNSTVTALKVSFHCLLLTHCSTLLFKHISVSTVVTLVFWLIYMFAQDFSNSGVISVVFIVISLITVYHKEIKMRVYSNLKTLADKELRKIQELLTQMVPTHAYENLMAEDFVIDKLSQVTLIYADIVGFTAWSSNRYPEEVVNMLNEMFTRFDRMCKEYNVYKVHTIGDCYVAMSYVGPNNRDPGQECLNILGFAKGMINVIKEVNLQHDMGISMRIGVHTGDVIGGITGKSIVRYDIYGNDVYIANHMESNGVAGSIAVSQFTHALISRYRPSLYQFQELKTITVFNNPIKIYIITNTD